MKGSLLLPLLSILASFGADNTDSNRISMTVEATVVSSYLWRGYVLDGSASFQPSIRVAMRGVSISAWSNYSRTVPYNQAWTETDLALEYTKTLRRFVLSAGVLDYYFPDLPPSQENRTEEVSFGLGYDTLLSPSFKVYHDVRGGHGNYLFASAQHSITVNHARRVSLNAAVGIGLNQHLYQRVTAISDVDSTVTLNVPTGRLVFSPFVSCMAGHRTLYGTHAAVGLKLAVAP